LREENRKKELKEKEDMKNEIAQLRWALELKENTSVVDKEKPQDRIVPNAPQSGVQDGATPNNVPK